MAQDPEVKALAERLAAWLNSPEGKRAMEQLEQEIEEQCRWLDEAVRVDPKIMNEPMTI